MQLKTVKTSGGVVADAVGKGHWKVRWDEGRLKGQTTDQSSKSLRLWELDLVAVDVESSGSSDSEDEVPTTAGDEHAERKRKFEVVAKSLEGKSVQVSAHPISLNRI